LLHEWPYYLFELELIGVVSYTLVYLPFWWMRKQAK
jgi:uncharacterized membrane protein YwaF